MIRAFCIAFWLATCCIALGIWLSIETRHQRRHNDAEGT
jgi:hypothetical protein